MRVPPSLGRADVAPRAPSDYIRLRASRQSFASPVASSRRSHEPTSRGRSLVRRRRLRPLLRRLLLFLGISRFAKSKYVHRKKGPQSCQEQDKE
ncbi:hypothetical protein CDD83_6372 [Cordyceps sp. RAO-2017]|nr:hypothetical protein CDD83_6372 [Cordyceps sp. RAO-2017]